MQLSKTYFLYVIFLVLNTESVNAQQVIELDVPKYYMSNYDCTMQPYADGSYSITAKGLTNFYSKEHALIRSSEGLKSKEPYTTKIKDSKYDVQSSVIDKKNKTSYTFKINENEAKLIIVNDNFEVLLKEKKHKIKDFFSHFAEHRSFIDDDGNVNVLVWQYALKPQDKFRKVIHYQFVKSSGDLNVFEFEIDKNNTIYLDFVGFLKGTPYFAGMPQPKMGGDIELHFYGLIRNNLEETTTRIIKVENNIKPSYIEGIRYDNVDDDEITLAIGVIEYDGPTSIKRYGFNFVEFTLDKLNTIQYWLDDLSYKGKPDMISKKKGDHKETVILKGVSQSVILDLDYLNETVTSPIYFKTETTLDYRYFWEFFLSINDVDESISDKYFELLGISKNEFLNGNSTVYDRPEILIIQKTSYVITKLKGSKRLEIYTNKYIK